MRLGVGLLTGALLVGLGCGTLPRLAEQERWDEVVAKAEKRRWPPKRKAARAYAAALDAQGRWEQARDVLLQDFRHGGELPSLWAAAEIEYRQGRLGIAAAHFSRAMDLDASTAGDHPHACDLLLTRAAALAQLDAGKAAAADLHRLERGCPAPTDATARARRQAVGEATARAQQAQLAGRIARSRCRDPECEEADVAQRRAALQDALEAADAGGPAALRHAAATLAVSLSAEQVVALLTADLTGELGAALVTDDEVRAWVGTQTWSDLAPVVMSQPDSVSAYAQLRLSLMTDAPQANRPRHGASESDKWALKVLEDTRTKAGWRLYGWQGDLMAAELEIGSTWRPARGASTAAESADTATEPAPHGHWTSRVPTTVESTPALLAVARLRHAAGQEDLALEITRDVATRAVAAGGPLHDVADAEVMWHLAWGRPWSALAVADAAGDDAGAGAAATAIVLSEAFCQGPCVDDVDLETVARVLGDDWITQQRETLDARVDAHAVARSEASDACPSLAEVWASDATGPTAAALAAARKQGVASPQALSAYTAAIESDVTLSCAGRWVMPLLAAVDASTTADAMVERLSQSGHDTPSTPLQAQLALVAGRPQHAELMAVAAAADSDDPVQTWAQLGRFAGRTGDTSLSRMSYREALLHSPDLDDPGIRRTLVLDRVADLGRSIPDDTRALLVESITEDLRTHVAGLAPAQRWAEREWLAAAIARAPWFGPSLRAPVTEALFGDPRIAQAHVTGRGWLGGIAPSKSPGPLDGAGQAQWATAGQPLPRGARVLADPSTLVQARLAVARHGRDYKQRWRVAIGLAVAGPADARRDAFAALLQIAPAPARPAIVEVLVRGGAAVGPAETPPAALGASTRAAVVVEEPDDVLALALDLPRAAGPRMEVAP